MHNNKFKKNVTTFSLMMTGVTSIMGSGWLLATQKVAIVAGPAGIFTWVIGMLIACLIAFFSIKISTTHPSAGGIGYYSMLTHGRFSGFITQWVNWLSTLVVPAIEAQAILQYISSSSKSFAQLYDLHDHVLTPIGIFYALILMIMFTLINYWGVKLFSKINNALTIIKIAIPIVTILLLFYNGFNPNNFGHSYQEFVPFGLSSIASAVISCGVIMSFNGFQNVLTFSEEVKNPKQQLPVAMIGSIIFCFIIFFMLQCIFIGSLSPQNLIHGWHNVNLRSPYVDLLIAANLQVFSWVVMSTSVIGPATAGAAFMASGSRMVYKLAHSRFLPTYFAELDKKHSSPRKSLLLNFIIGSSFLFFFKGWFQLVAIVSVLHVFSYLSMPIVAVAFSRQLKHSATKVKNLFVDYIVAFIILYILSVLLFYAGWEIIWKMSALVILGLFIFAYYEKNHKIHHHFIKYTLQGSWLIILLIGISLVTYLGNNGKTNSISNGTSVFLVLIISVIVFVIGIVTANKEIHVMTE
jgi:amino acid transporter